MLEVIILRGPAGSGKSTWVEKNCPDAVVVSADQFWLKRDLEGNEVYEFCISRLAEAHQDCLCRYVDALAAKKARVVVDNTNIHRWEYAAYLRIAQEFGYAFRIIEFRPDTVEGIRTCIQRNVHGVPRETIMKMCVDFEPDERASEIFPISS